MILSVAIDGDRDFNWRDLAKCAGMAQPREKDPAKNPEGKVTDFFFDTYEEDSETRVHTKKICFTCPVRDNCLDEAVSNGYTGVWGGEYLDNGVIQH